MMKIDDFIDGNMFKLKILTSTKIEVLGKTALQYFMGPFILSQEDKGHSTCPQGDHT